MTTEEGPDSLVLRYLRKLDAGQDAVRADLREIKARLSVLEQQAAQTLAMYATLSQRADRVDERLERIERRLELREPVVA